MLVICLTVCIYLDYDHSVDDIDKFCDILEKLDVPFVKKPNGGALKKIAFVKDPTGYWVEIVQRAIPGKILGVH